MMHRYGNYKIEGYSAEILQSITPEGIGRFLKSTGWSEYEIHPNATAYKCDTEELAVDVPLKRYYRDYVLRVDEIVKMMAVR